METVIDHYEPPVKYTQAELDEFSEFTKTTRCATEGTGSILQELTNDVNSDLLPSVVSKNLTKHYRVIKFHWKLIILCIPLYSAIFRIRLIKLKNIFKKVYSAIFRTVGTQFKHFDLKYNCIPLYSACAEYVEHLRKNNNKTYYNDLAIICPLIYIFADNS